MCIRDRATSGFIASPTGATSVVGTNGATFYITGVQLEVGSIATGYEYRNYQQELALCQRYLPAYNRIGNDPICTGQTTSATTGIFIYPFNVTPRTPPTGLTASTASGFYALTPNGASAATASAIALGASSSLSAYVSVTFANNGGSAGQSNVLFGGSAGAQLLFTGCEL